MGVQRQDPNRLDGNQGDDGAAEELAFEVHSAMLHMMRRVRREDAAAGLSAPRMSALSCVAFGMPRTLGDLAAMEQVSPPTMTRLVAALEDGGYVVRRADKRDRRVAWIHATAKGRRTIEAGRARRVAFLAGQLRGFGPDDRAAIKRTAAILHEVYQRSR